MAVTLAELHSLPFGTVLQKGKQKRILLGMDGLFIYCKTPSGRSTIGESIIHFREWLLKAEIVKDEEK
jgi:hypothetical protein